MAASGAAGATAGTTLVEIVSPERLLLSKPIEMAVLPGGEGDLASMPGTAPMIVTLRGGVVRLYRAGAVTDRLFVAGGFAEITESRCTVLADEAIPVAELDRPVAEAALRDAEAAYQSADRQDIAAIDRTLAGLQVARARIEALERQDAA